jgi:hypothetical protein
MKKMNFRRYLLATFALFAFIFLCDIFVHGFFLKGMYEASANVWRDFAEMEARMPLSMCFQLALSAWIAFIFSQLYPGGSIKNGLLFGLFFGVFAGILTASWYLLLNVPAKLGFSWLISGIVEGLGGGLVLGLIYRK